MVKNLPAMRVTGVQSLGQEDPLEKEMATHSSILAWEIPLTLPYLCTIVFLTAPPLSLLSLTSLVSNCLNCPFGTQGRCRKLRPFSYKHEMMDPERLLYLGAPHNDAQFTVKCLHSGPLQLFSLSQVSAEFSFIVL